MMDDLLMDLASAGFVVGSISELRTSGVRYRDAVPVLVSWLPRAKSWAAKEQIVRALSVPWARAEALEPLIEEFRAAPVPGDPKRELLRWAVGNGIEVLWDDVRFDDWLSWCATSASARREKALSKLT